MFVVVQGLAAQGWLDWAGTRLGHASGTSLGAAVWCTGVLAAVLGCVMSNQPMAVLLSALCTSSGFTAAVAAAQQGQAQQAQHAMAALLAVAAGSHIAASVTLVGSFSGVMWACLIRGMGVQIGYVEYARTVVPVGITALVSALMVLWLELALFPAESSPAAES